MRCIICDSNDWENIDHLRESAKGMHMCKSCGFVSYPNAYKTEEEIKEHYRKNYRGAPSVQNLYTGERKLYYHEEFLRPLIEEWKKAGIKPVIGEVGSAFGLFLVWLQKQLECEVHGTELTLSYRRVAFHEYGLKLTEDFDFTRPYDLIASYHVLEHQLDADKYLRRMMEALAPNGVIYLGTPVWWREATNFGGQGFDLGYYWAPDHINCWSEEHLEYLIAKAGLKIIGKDTKIYGNTYILARSGEDVVVTPKFDAEKYKQMTAAIQNCWKALQTNETALAIEAWPNCPAAWVNHFEVNRQKFNKDREEMMNFINAAIAACPNSSDTITLAGDLMMRYEKYEKAYDLFATALKRKPNNPTILMAMANCLRQKAIRTTDEAKKKSLFKECRNIIEHTRTVSLELQGQCITWSYNDASNIPMEGE